LIEPVIRRVGEDELPTVLRLWQEAGVNPPSVSDSIEGLTRLMREPAALLLVATIGSQIVGSSSARSPNSDKQGGGGARRRYAGIDIGGECHAVSVVNDDGTL
jgi:hypothetical protein